MHSTINVCFMCITDKNCTDVNKNVLTLVEYILPEITLIKLDVNLRICSVCEETICLFSKFKGICVENSLLLETTIKEAQSYKNSTNGENSAASTSNQQIEEVCLKPKILPDTSQNGKESESEKEESNDEKDNIDDNLEGNSSTEEEKITSKNNTSCPICKSVFTHKYGVQQHILRMHTEKKHKCHLCPAKFARKCDLNKHFVVVHSKIKKFPCTKCSKRFPRKSDLNDHYKRCLRPNNMTKPKKEEKEKNYKCNECNRSFWQKPNLILHMKVHDEKSKIKCTLCPESFTKAGINFHLQAHEKRKKIKCYCGELYSHNIHSKHHPDFQHEAKTKYVRKRVECPECKRSIREDYMKEHIRVHQTEKEYHCHICEKKFNQQGSLQVHMLRGVHEKVKRS